MSKCLNPNCDKKARIRGLCLLCYIAAARLVRRGRTTWEDLVNNGKALERGAMRHGRTAWLLSTDDE